MLKTAMITSFPSLLQSSNMSFPFTEHMNKCRLNLGFSALSVTVVLFQAALETMRWKELEETRERAAKLRGEGLASRNSAGVRPVTTLRCWETSDRPIYRFGGHLEFYFSQKDIMGDLERKCTHGCGYKFGLKIVKLVFILYPLFHTIINLRQKKMWSTFIPMTCMHLLSWASHNIYSRRQSNR